MNILADTHILLWSLYDEKKLSDPAREYLMDENNRIYYSLVSIWEVEIKHSLGKMPVSSDELMKDCEYMGFLPLNLKKEHIIGLKELRKNNYGHKDPFDRMLIAQTLTENFYFLTQDNKIKQYPSELIL